MKRPRIDLARPRRWARDNRSELLVTVVLLIWWVLCMVFIFALLHWVFG